MRRRTTENIKEYINNLKFKMIFDDGKPGQVYFLDVASHTIILFFVDIPDRCVYINQDIIDELATIIRSVLNPAVFVPIFIKFFFSR